MRARSSNDPTLEEAFHVLETKVDTNNSLRDVAFTMPNKKRLTQLSIMVCDTISSVRSRTILKVLFNPG
jgi:hypothetical protein